MKKVDRKVLDKIYSRLSESERQLTQQEIDDEKAKQWFDSLVAPPMSYYFTIEDIVKFKDIALDPRLNNNPTEKYNQIGKIMNMRGFTLIGGGTNRRAFVSYDYRVVAKVATDKVGISNNHKEYINQHVLKPFCIKIFEVSLCGTLAICERFVPIKTLEEFEQIADRVFDILLFKIRNKNIGMEDIGSRSFKNWGIRDGFGPGLLDYPTMYVVDPKKCYCTQTDRFGNMCNCTLDYDEGFDNIICSGCGHRYLSKALAKKDGDKITELISAVSNNKKINKGVSNMIIKPYRENAEETKATSMRKSDFVDPLSYDIDQENSNSNSKSVEDTSVGGAVIRRASYEYNFEQPLQQKEKDYSEAPKPYTRNRSNLEIELELFDSIIDIVNLANNDNNIFFSFLDSIASNCSRINADISSNRYSIFRGILNAIPYSYRFFKKIVDITSKIVRDNIVPISIIGDEKINEIIDNHPGERYVIYGYTNIVEMLKIMKECFNKLECDIISGNNIDDTTVKKAFSNYEESIIIDNPSNDRKFIVCAISPDGLHRAVLDIIDLDIKTDNFDDVKIRRNEVDYKEECDNSDKEEKIFGLILDMMLDPTDEFIEYVAQNADIRAEKLIENIKNIIEETTKNFENSEAEYEDCDEDDNEEVEPSINDGDGDDTSTFLNDPHLFNPAKASAARRYNNNNKRKNKNKK